MKPSSFGARALRFYRSLESPAVPRGVVVMNPYAEARILRYLRSFLAKYFDDSRKRLLIFGINPGRFGAGITGITFTDPVALSDACGIPNHLPRRRELSSIFVYQFIERFGGPGAFYRDFFLTAACPLGFTRAGKNLNYYDDRRLARALTPFIVDSVERQIALGGRRDAAVVMGKGQNFHFFERLNAEQRWFAALYPLDHPRPIMQYRRKRLGEYVEAYESLLTKLRPEPLAPPRSATP